LCGAAADGDPPYGWIGTSRPGGTPKRGGEKFPDRGTGFAKAGEPTTAAPGCPPNAAFDASAFRARRRGARHVGRERGRRTWAGRTVRHTTWCTAPETT